jgi:hypothetical protein
MLSDIPDPASTLTMVLAALFALLSLCVLCVGGMHVQSRRVGIQLSLLITVSLAMLPLFLRDAIPAALSLDTGVMLATYWLVGFMSIGGIMDRMRSLATLTLGIAGATGLSLLVPHAQEILPPATHPLTPFYALLLAASAFHLALLWMIEPHPARYPFGVPRIPAFSMAQPPASLLLTFALALLQWRIQAFDAFGTSIFAYSALLATLLAMTGAMLFGRYFQRDDMLSAIAAAAPSGVLVIAMLPASDYSFLGMPVLAGALVAMGRHGLRVLRLDDPSGLIAALGIPVLTGWIAAGVLDLARLAAQLQWIGAALAAGVALALLLAFACRIFFGLHASIRAVEEGLDNAT